MKKEFACLVFTVFLFSACTPAEEPVENPDEAETALPEVQMSTDQFLEKVISAGGGADFIFQPEDYDNDCHASTLASLDDGTLVAAWFWGSEEGKPDVGIWMSRFHG